MKFCSQYMQQICCIYCLLVQQICCIIGLLFKQQLATSYSEFKRWLIAQGVVLVRRGKGSHWIIQLHDKRSVFPDHGSKEIPEGTRLKIKKDLGL